MVVYKRLMMFSQIYYPIARCRARSRMTTIVKWGLTVVLVSQILLLTAEVQSKENNKGEEYQLKEQLGKEHLSKEHLKKNIAYGIVLYEFFQKNYFYAMSEILVAEQQNNLSYHQDASELLLGGMQLSYGMDQQAQRTFESVLSKTHLPVSTARSKKHLENRARAWFYLGKLAYQKDNIPLALNALSRVDNQLTPSLYDELAFLHEKSFFELSKQQSESDFLAELSFSPKLSSTSIYRYYRDYNNAVEAVHLGDAKWETSVNQLERLYKAINESKNTDDFDELMELRDKVLTTLGYLYLREGKSKKAIHFFSQVRQGSTQEGSALVGYGWASINNKSSENVIHKIDYEAALTPWLRLQSRSMDESTTYEALLAVPFIYNASGLNEHALKAYDYALDKMTKELTALAQLKKELQNCKASNDLSLILGLNTSDHSKEPLGGHWLDSEAELIAPAMIDSPRLQQHLSELLAKKFMRSLFGQLNDIYWLESHLVNWRSRIDTLDFAIQERQLRAIDLLSGIAQDQFTIRLNKILVRYDQLSTTLAKAQRLDGLYLLLTENEKASEARIKSALLSLANIEAQLTAEKNTASNNQLPSIDKLKTRRLQLENMQGMLYWQVSIDAASRIWDKQKSQDAIMLALEEAKARVGVFPILVNKITEQSADRQRLDNVRQRIELQSSGLAALRGKLEVSIVAHLNKELADRESRLMRYIGKARLSKAALLERQLDTSVLVNPVINSMTKTKKNDKQVDLGEQG